MTSCSTGGIIVTNIAYEYGCPGSNPRLDNFFFRFLRFFVQFFFNARNILSIISSTAGKIAGKTVYPVPALYNLPFFIHKNRSRNFDTGWVSYHISMVFIPIPFKPQKGTPTMVAPSTFNFQLILPRRLPCRRDRPSTLFYANNRS